MTITTRPVDGAGTQAIGGDLVVNRLGFGAARITGAGAWGEPPSRQEAVRVLRQAVDLGVNLIDTADAYGPYVSEELIRAALHPYDGLVIATKGGRVRSGPGPAGWADVGNPAYLRQCVEMSLRRLGLDTIDLYQLHRIDPAVPLADQIGTLADLRAQGKIRHIGLSEVSVAQIEAAREIVEVVSVQNEYNVADRHDEDVLGYCERESLGFLAWAPVGTGGLARPGGPLEQFSAEAGATPAQLALAWLLRHSPVLLPIPGTGSLTHLVENCAAATFQLSDEQYARLTALA